MHDMDMDGALASITDARSNISIRPSIRYQLQARFFVWCFSEAKARSPFRLTVMLKPSGLLQEK